MKQFGFRPVLAGVAFALATATALAAPAPAVSTDGSAAMTKHKEGGHHRGHHFMRGALMIPGVGPIGRRQVAALKLTSAQQTQFNTAAASQDALRQQMRSSFRAHRKALSDQIAAGKLDPHALLADFAHDRDQFRPESDKVRNQWLAVWDSLSDGQRQQVTNFMKKRESWMEKHRHHGWHGAHHPSMPIAHPAATPPAPAPAP